MNDNNIEEKNYRMILHDQMKKRYRIRIIIDKLVSVFGCGSLVPKRSIS